MNRSKPVPLHIWLIAVAVLLVFGIGAFYFSQSGNQSFRTSPVLDAATYATAADSLVGNTYKVEGTVDNLLDWSPSQGRLISIRLSREDRLLPLVVTKEFNSTNIQKGQSYLFLVEVKPKGILYTKALKIL